jgi:hypothetical protein
MEKVEEGSSGKNSYSEDSESGRHDTQETKQERLDRFRAAAWHQNNVEEENTEGRRVTTAEGTKPGSSDSKANTKKGITSTSIVSTTTAASTRKLDRHSLRFRQATPAGRVRVAYGCRLHHRQRR